MRAMVRHTYGRPEVLKLEEVPKPTAGEDELLIRVHAVSLNLGDWELLTGEPMYIAVLAKILGPKPRLDPVSLTNDGASASDPTGGRFLKPKYKILGSDIAGRVEAVGKNVRQFQPGDEVFGDISLRGGLCEYTCVPESAALVQKPAGMTFEEAAAIPQAAFIALQALRDREQVQPGQKVLINGAGGGAGTFAVQFARSLGAEVTGVDSTMKLDMVRSIGADHVLNYMQEDFTQTGQCHDLILDLAVHRSVFDCRRALSPQGIYLLAGGSLAPTLQAVFLGPLISRTGTKKVAFLLAKSSTEALVHMTELYAAGTVVPVIDHSYPLSEAAEAFRHLGEGRSKGKVVVTV